MTGKMQSDSIRTIHGPTNFFIESQFAMAYSDIGDHDDEIVHLHKSVELRPNEENLYNLGLAYQEKGDITDARKYYRLALQATDHHLAPPPHRHLLQTYIRYASALLTSENTLEDVPIIQAGLHDYPDSWELWFLLSVAEAKDNDREGALAAARRAYALKPNQETSGIYQALLNNQPITFPGVQ
jgi:tetratricopeptide (TPR) repeat protein